MNSSASEKLSPRGASDTAQWETGLAAKPGDLSSGPRIHMVGGENLPSQVTLGVPPGKWQ